jgi:DNA-binding NarL/FixJ family response regulator
MNGKIKVLLVERDPQVSQLLLLLLAAPDAPRLRFEPVCVADVEAGLRSIARGDRVDAVVLGLPRDGIGALERLRALRRQAPNVPIVALVEPGGEARGRVAVKLGAEGFQVRGRLNSGALKRSLSGEAVGSRPSAA